jgi:primase-polymerase (primpol)-like protein
VAHADRSRRFDGVGFVLGDGWAGIDLDHCRDDDGQIIDAAWMPLARLTCYVEVSPSGHGPKAIGRAARIGGEVNLGAEPIAFTTWTGARFSLSV